jgi:hypothetical protein
MVNGLNPPAPAGSKGDGARGKDVALSNSNDDHNNDKNYSNGSNCLVSLISSLRSLSQF